MAKRLISSAVGIVIGIIILILSDTPVLTVSLAIFAVMGIYELYKADNCLEFKAITATAMIYGAVSPFIRLFGTELYHDIFTATAIIVMFSCYLPVHSRMNIEKLFFAVAAPILLNYSLDTLYKLHELSDQHGAIFILLALCGAWIADGAAYFTGTFMGKRKLCPNISPKKTVEGFVGGVIFNGIFFVIFNLIYISFFAKGCSVNYISSFFLGIICAGIGTVGDLSASLIKRSCGIKDYGNIMPGHGGFMDRFDSVLFVAPFMYAYLSVFNIYG